jgi:hypothetical protein
MGASPEMFRGVDGSRIAAVSVFFRSLAIIAPVRAPQSPFLVKLWRIALAFDEQSRSKQRREGDLLPCRDAAFVQMNVENRTGDFVPRFSIMHGCIESRAGH